MDREVRYFASDQEFNSKKLLIFKVLFVKNFNFI
jgi:hypothetical protein